MNYCVPSAYVVGPRGQLSDDPTDHQWQNRHSTGGCNRLVCTRCKADVKVLASDAERRLYACNCLEHSASEGCWTTEEHFTQFGDREVQENLPWTCGGHPPLELPFPFGDRTIVERAELAVAIVEAAKDSAQHELVLSLHHRTKTGSLDGIVPRALAVAAAGEEPLAGPMKALFARNPVLAPLESLAKELARRSSTERRAQLVDILAHSVSYRPPGFVMEKTIALLRREAQKGVITAEQLRVLSSYDMEWLVANVEELLARGTEEHAGPLLAWGGRSILLMSSFTDEGVRRTQALARKTGLGVETLIARVDEASGIWPAETRAVVEALRRMRGPLTPGP